jgi:ABC-2 type transport system ATP-binding protein
VYHGYNQDVTADSVALSCKGVVKRYGKVTAVDGLDLTVRRGECFGLLGPNGAGKTTTIEILEGLLPADAGEVTVLGRRWATDAAALRPRLGIQLQETQLADKLTVAETVRLFRSFYPTGPSVDELLDTVELAAKRDAWVVRLSGGQRQRLSVACALAGRPELLFLDEPTTGLDPQSRRQLWDVLERFRAGGGTILITTHYMDEAHALCDRVGIVDQGRLIALGTPRELVASLGADHVVECAFEHGEAVEASLLSALPGVRDVRRDGGHWHLSTSELHLTVPALLDLVRQRHTALSQLSTHGATLEDVFVTLTGRQLRDA